MQFIDLNNSQTILNQIIQFIGNMTWVSHIMKKKIPRCRKLS